MKSIKFIFGAFLFLFAIESQAQVSVSLNIGTNRPTWCNHYHDEVEYVYFPELECYYDMYSAVYIYYGPNGWIRSRYLPEYCHGYDFDRGYRVAIDYRGRSPWVYFNDHRRMYYRDNYRNYREAYYGPSYNRRGNYVAVTRRDDYDGDRGGYRRDNDRGYAYGGERNEHEGHGEGNGHGYGRGHGRR